MDCLTFESLFKSFWFISMRTKVRLTSQTNPSSAISWVDVNVFGYDLLIPKLVLHCIPAASSLPHTLLHWSINCISASSLTDTWPRDLSQGLSVYVSSPWATFFSLPFGLACDSCLRKRMLCAWWFSMDTWVLEFDVAGKWVASLGCIMLVFLCVLQG